MKIRPRNLNRFGAAVALCISLSICFANCLGFFAASDDYLYDLALAAKAPAPNDDVLLVYTPKSYFLEQDCSKLSMLAHQLFAFEAKQVGILFDPDKQQYDSLNGLPFVEKIVVGTSLTSLATNDELNSNDSVTPTVARGFRDLSLEQTVYRDHPTTVTLNEVNYASFENVIAKRLLPSNALPNGRLGINFAGGPEGLPHIFSKDVIDQKIVSELVQGKVVLIGPEPGDDIGLVTPTTRGSGRMSRLQLHGNILNTMILQNQIKTADGSFAIALLLLTTIIGCQIFRQVPSAILYRCYTCCLLTVFLLGWLVLHGLSTTLPLSAMLVAVSLTMLTGLYSRFETLRLLIESWTLMRQTGTNADWRAEEKDTWTLVADSVYQIFYPNRMVLMEFEPGATHLTVTKTIHCSSGDIFERRRDVNRAPYRDAVELGAAMRIQNRQFFEINQETECFEYIAPLIIVSELVGFMVLEMTAESVKNWDDFENFLTQFTSDMAVLVNKYRVLEQQESRQRNFIEKLKQVPEQSRKMSLFQSEVEHQNLENLLGDAFETIQTAGVICDVFGRTIKTNAKMVELLQRNGIVVADTDCISLLESFTRWQKNDCRKIFRQCVVEGRTQQIFLPQEGNQQASRVLYLEPLSKGDDEPEISSRCVCIQVVEGKIFQESQQWQQEFANNNLRHVVHRLVELQEFSGRHWAGTIDQTIPVAQSLENQILDTIAECQTMLGTQFSEEPNKFVLVDSRSVWESCVGKVQSKLDARNINIASRFEAQSPETIANPFLLERIFETILDCITHDAAENTEILVASEHIDTKVYYHFSDTVDSVPIKGLRKSLDIETDGNATGFRQGVGISVLTPSQIDQLREIESWLQAWDASLTIGCSEGYRISVQLTLSTELNPHRHSAKHSSIDFMQNSKQV